MTRYGSLIAAILTLFQACSASICGAAPEAPWACADYENDCLAGRAAEPCVCLKGYHHVGKESWSPSIHKNYEFTCCPGEGKGNSCGEDSYVQVIFPSLLGVGLLGVTISTIVIQRRQGLAPLTKEDLAVTENPVMLDGSRLHQMVEKSMWCVTLDDLRQFGRLVRHAIAKGAIQPTDQDPFDTADIRIGPSVYTVTMQYIKPVTAAAGNPSWALMKHPKGLVCDLFITHGWAEGIFEFVDQVVNSWPPGAKSAYVCFLSNPQNLDIAEMIANPEESPFAKALASATEVLAAPNRKESIYQRAWCCFEAYLAYSWGKPIYTAFSPPPHFWSKSLRASSWALLMLGTCVSVVMIGNRQWALVKASHINLMTPIFAGLAALCGCMFTFLMRAGKCHWKLTEAAVFGCSTFTACYVATYTFDNSLRRPACFVPMFMAPICAWALECDRLMGLEAAKQARHLRAGFTGKIRDAKTSNPVDGEQILNSIERSGLEAAVDEAVAVLLRMYLSTPTLRHATAVAGTLGNGLNWSRSIFAYSMWLWLLQAFNTPLWRTEPGFEWIPPVAGVEVVLMGILPQLQARDRRPFANRAQSLLLLFVPLFIPGINLGGKWRDAILHAAAAPLMILVAAAGPRYTARFPLLGPPIVRLLFGRNPFRRETEGQKGDAAEPTASGGAQAAEEEDDFVSL
ncbi:unnamed protein product [Symbiodinium natans]|uniref:Uncharacterized protein n=1 Tax=Symbiodinium natans TaxID=878477 RepID=A0A812KCF3_9DINO|nr:unnamed protein product [Symbiodinium natans]